MKSSSKPYTTSYVVMRSAAARHLAVSVPTVANSMAAMGSTALPGDRYDLADLWRRMWGIHSVPLGLAPVMAAPLLTIDQVATMVDVTTHTIRRAGNARDPKWNLPEHVDLGPRVRRYLPLHIRAWILRRTPEPWLERRRGPKGPIGLILKGAEGRIGRSI